MTRNEKLIYLSQLEERILEHRYRYYILGDSVLSDFEYDFIEKFYIKIGKELNVPTHIEDMVDFNYTYPGAIEAKNRVESGTDNYSLWEESMKLVWQRLGYPKYERQRIQRKNVEA